MKRPLMLLALVLLAVLPGLPGLDHPFLLDDHLIVVENPDLLPGRAWHEYFTDPDTYSASAHFDAVCYRPWMVASNAWAVRTFGVRPAPLRAINLLLHALVVLAAWGFGCALLAALAPEEAPRSGAWLPWAAAALLAVHPLSAFSTHYISNRATLIMSLGLYLAMLGWVRWRQGLRGGGGLLALGLVLVLTGKESGVTVLGYLVLLELTLRGSARSAGSSLRALAAPVLAVLAYFGLRRLLGLGFDQHGPGGPALESWLGYVLTQAQAFWTHYLWNFAWPTGIRFEPAIAGADPARPLAWLPVLGIAAYLGGAVVLARRGRRVLAFCLLAWPLTMLPTAVLPQPLWVNHYRPYPGSYLVYLGLASGLASGLGRGARGRGGVAGLVLLLALLVGGSLRQGRLASTPTQAWLHSVRYGGTSRVELALAAEVRDPLARLQALNRVLHRFPSLARAYWVRAETLIDLGRGREALEDLAVTVGALPGADPALRERVERARAPGGNIRDGILAATEVTRRAGFGYMADRLLRRLTASKNP